MPPAVGREAGGGLARVGPDHAVGQPGQPGDLLAEQRRVVALPAVGQHHHDRAAGRAALPPAVEELLEEHAEPGAAPRVRAHRADQAQRDVGVAVGHLAGDPGQPGAEDEHLRGGAAAPRAAAWAKRSSASA